MAIAEKYLPHYTYDDWLHWEGQWELIYGIPIAMTPMPIPKHQMIAAELTTELSLALRNTGCKNCRVYEPIDYKVADDIIIQPDVLIVCKDIEKKFLDFAPELVVEILSPSTAIKDQNTKFEIYQDQKIKYYLIVDIQNEVIEVNQLEEDKYQMQKYQHGYTFDITEKCVIKPDLHNIWK